MSCGESCTLSTFVTIRALNDSDVFLGQECPRFALQLEIGPRIRIGLNNKMINGLDGSFYHRYGTIVLESIESAVNFPNQR